MPYAILRFKKHPRGTVSHMENHNERKKEKYKSNPDIDTERIKNNYHLIKPDGTYHQEINRRIKAAGCRVRKDSNLMIETLITASPEFMKELSEEQQREYFMHALTFISAEVDAKNIFSAVVHMDESNPHMHLCFTPITPDNRLSAKIIMGDPKKLSEWQDKYHAHMSAKYPSLERGIPANISKRKHLPVRLFKQAKRLEEQMDGIRQALSDVTVFNAGKKREEALQMLAKWLPSAESFSRTVKKNEEEIKALEAANKSLEKQLEKKTEQLDSAFVDAALLRQTAEKQRKLLDKIPKELIDELKAVKKEKQK